MPNRSDLAPTRRRATSAAAPTPSDAWPIIVFCAIGFLLSLYVAISAVGIDAIPKMMGQFPGLG